MTGHTVKLALCIVALLLCPAIASSQHAVRHCLRVQLATGYGQEGGNCSGTISDSRRG
jgi:hypothetical protein